MAIDKASLKKIGHVISGLVVIIKGYDKFENHHPEVGILLILLGLIFVSFAVFHHRISWIAKHEPWLLWLEGLALAIVSYSYFAAGKFALPFVMPYVRWPTSWLAVTFINTKGPTR